jgi:membrane dipeptidase
MEGSTGVNQKPGSTDRAARGYPSIDAHALTAPGERYTVHGPTMTERAKRPLSAAEEERARRLHAETYVFAYGRAAIAEMNRLGIVIDVSHMSDDGIRDTLETSADPIIASHSNARALCAQPRNLPDDLARAIGRGGGVIGLHMLSQFLTSAGEATLDDFLDHVDHLVKLVGPAHVGLGPDCMEQWPAQTYRELWAGTEMSTLEFRYPAEFDSLGKCGNVTRGLVARGYDDAAIRGIMGENFLRVFKAVLS